MLDESQLLRSEIAVEIENLRPVVGWVERGYSMALSLWSFWPLIGGVAGFFVARKKGSVVRKVGKIWSFWRVGKKALEVFQRFYSGRASAPPPD